MPLSKLFPCFQFRLEDNIHKLDYSNNVLSEGFPHVWQHERTLEELNVTSTRINYLPPQLFYCQGLKVLLASSNNLESIPEAIGTLRQLHQLNLSRNFISYVPDNIKSCKHLTYLDLSCNSLRKLPDAITCLISLQELILNETFLEFLPANFGRLVNLRIVELRSNNLLSLPKSMQRLTNLQRLDIGCNEFVKLPDVIGDLKQLRELWFDSNQIQSLPIQTGKLRELIHFEANGNCLNSLPNEIGSWHNLEVISVSTNNLVTLPFSIGMLKSLVTLKCESNELTELPTCISSLENLEELVVSYNRLSCLPNTIGMLRKLRYLFADNNILHKLPEEICSCSALSIVSVSRNKLSALPDNLGHLTNLKVLNIVQNNIETLPVSLLSLVNLMSLWISNNQSQPLIPLQYTEILKKTQLTCFMLPQLITKQKDQIDNNMITENNYATQLEELTHKAAACTISKRRICFAEEATILHNDQPIPNLSMSSYPPNDNNFVSLNENCSQPKNSANICEENEILDELQNRKKYLMRSPTPYPKELRMLAKYVQINHQKTLHDNGDKSVQQIPTSSQKLNTNDIESSAHNNYPAQRNIHENSNLYTTRNSVACRMDTNLDNISEQQQCQIVSNNSEISINNELPCDLNQEFLMAHHSLKPPPYHIARCFTKKSVDDLSKYDVTRKQQEQYQPLQDSDHFNQNLLLPESETVLDNQISSNRNLNFEHQYNSMIQGTESNNRHKSYNASEGIENSQLSSGNKFVGDDITSANSNNLSKRKTNKGKTKWLFGAHKNPRVLQINVNLENGVEFEINTLSNREGIFIVSTAPGSKASQLLSPLDKLLEVDGIDFTNISIQEARHVLRNSRPSVSIMLSRK